MRNVLVVGHIKAPGPLFRVNGAANRHNQPGSPSRSLKFHHRDTEFTETNQNHFSALCVLCASVVKFDFFSGPFAVSYLRSGLQLEFSQGVFLAVQVQVRGHHKRRGKDRSPVAVER